MRGVWRLALFVCLVFSAAQARMVGYPSNGYTILQIGPGLWMAGKIRKPGAGFSIYGKLDAKSAFYLGIDSGVFFQTVPNMVAYVPMLPSVFFRFETGLFMVPTLGVSLGPIFSFGTGVKFVDFMITANPGFQFTLDDEADLFVRFNLGMIGSTVIFYPQVGATFRM